MGKTNRNGRSRVITHPVPSRWVRVPATGNSWIRVAPLHVFTDAYLSKTTTFPMHRKCRYVRYSGFRKVMRFIGAPDSTLYHPQLCEAVYLLALVARLVLD